ncbi:MAG: amidase [Acidimicrobiales bacterium]
MTDELASLDATAQADLVRRRQISPKELVEAAMARIEALNPTVNAVIHQTFDEARDAAASLGDRLAAGEATGPLGAVPFLIKDIGATQAGLPYWSGNRALKELDHRRNDDTVLGARFRRAGLVTLGKTNLPELGSSPTTQPLSCGPTHNPWDLERSPAGSSGGSAAAVASGMVPLAHANDGGGSTRLPAAWCGLVGLKTTRGRVANPDTVSRLVSELVVTRTVRDTALVLDSVCGTTDADLFATAPPLGPYVDELGRVAAPLRVGLCLDGGQYPVDPGCVAAVEAAGSALEAAGHRVGPFDGSILFGPASAVNGRLWMAGIARRVGHLGQLIGRELTEDEVEPYNWAAAQRGRTMLATEWVAAEEEQQSWVRRAIGSMEGVDLLVTPTAGCPPMRTADLEPPADKPWRIGRTYGMIGQFTLPFNVTGNPAISLPLHTTDAGLPVGVQLVAPMGREDLLLRLSSHLERALPWAHRRPAVFA